ncbi:hypothetical protein [Sedimenticola hydrogenitrophicus]|uniref:hypothetical protein n=1 Tax=Sedimenticola hydrogenitrophicus TaxID=2967975 RepID=UPI0021A46235|nr:hypothetical protein [Sedimenticola hydrogenitrophicus]
MGWVEDTGTTRRVPASPKSEKIRLFIGIPAGTAGFARTLFVTHRRALASAPITLFTVLMMHFIRPFAEVVIIIIPIGTSTHCQISNKYWLEIDGQVIFFTAKWIEITT